MKLSVVIGALLLFSSAQAQLQWRFNADNSGWSVVDLPSQGNYLNTIGNFPVNWLPSGGAVGGYISRADPSNNAFFFQVTLPTSLSPYFGGKIEFWLRCTHQTWNGDAFVMLVSSNSVIVTPITPLPRPNWERYEIPLVAGKWRFNNGGGALLTDAQLANFLAVATRLRVSGEFGSQVQETTDLDEVRIHAPLPGDTDFSGCVDDADLTNIILDFGGPPMNGGTDANGDGVVDDADLTELILNFGAGC